MYVTPDTLRTHLGKTHLAGLNFFHLNAQSVRNKRISLEIFFTQIGFQFDVIMLSETWFTTDEDVFKIPGYNVFFLNRPSRQGGGVSMLIKDIYQCGMIPAFTCTNYDYEILSVKLKDYVISVLYRPPSGSHVLLLSYLERFFDYCVNNELKIICGGDFNVDMSSHGSITNEMTWLFHSFNLTNVINSPTRVTANNSTLIDFFLIGSDTTNVKAGVIACDLSDHLPIFMAIERNYRVKKQPVRARHISCENLDHFRNDVLEIDWMDVCSATNASTAMDTFIEKIKHLYDQCFPTKSLPPPERSVSPG